MGLGFLALALQDLGAIRDHLVLDLHCGVWSKFLQVAVMSELVFLLLQL